MNLTELKNELQKLGISTSTPGLYGDERFEELKFRYDQAIGTNKQKSPSHSGKKTSSNVEEFKNLSIGELRSRLTDLGISTQTPGLSGEERWNALLERLIVSICGSTEEEQEELPSPKAEVAEPPKPRNRLPPELPPPTIEKPPVVEAVIAPIEEPEPDNKASISLEEKSYAQINELKKRIKAITNKRSIYIASKFSGEGQDPTLKRCTLQLSYVEQDISMCTGIVAKGENKVYADSLKSIALLGDIISAAKDMTTSVTKVLPQLETQKSSLKEEIRLKRQYIREEADRHPDFGVQVENALREELNKENFLNTKISRTRQKLNMMKSVYENLSAETSESKKDYFVLAMEKKLGKIQPISSSDATPQEAKVVPNTKPNEIAAQNDMISSSGKSIPVAEEKLMPNSGSEKQKLSSKIESDSNLTAKPAMAAKQIPIQTEVKPPEIKSNKQDSDSEEDDEDDEEDEDSDDEESEEETEDEEDESDPDEKRRKAQTKSNTQVNRSNVKEKNAEKLTIEGKKFFSPPMKKKSQDDAEEEDSSASVQRALNFDDDVASASSPVSSTGTLSKAPTETILAPSNSDVEEVMRNITQENSESLSSPSPNRSPQKFAYLQIKPTTPKSFDEKEEDGDAMKTDDDNDLHPSKSRPLPNGPNVLKSTTPMARPPPPAHSPPKSMAKSNSFEDPDLGDEVEGFTDPVDVMNHHFAIQREQKAVQRKLERGGDMTHHPSDDDEDEEVEDDRTQLITLYEHAKVLEQLNDIPAAEVIYERALDMDPTNITTLQAMAIFLSQKKGELERAEAFFNRALQLCLPSIFKQIHSPTKAKMSVSVSVPVEGKESMKEEDEEIDVAKAVAAVTAAIVKPGTQISTRTGRMGSSGGSGLAITSVPLEELTTITPTKSLSLKLSQPPGAFSLTEERYSIRQITSLLMSFSKFMFKSRGDIEIAYILMKKAIKLSPKSGFVLATFAHFLSYYSTNLFDPINQKQIEEYYQVAMKLDPQNPIYIMWYGNFLKKIKQIARAEFLYKTAMLIAIEEDKMNKNEKQVATCICNYATFLFKQKKKFVKAENIFVDAINSYPNHKGLKKNYRHLLKYKQDHPEKFIAPKNVEDDEEQSQKFTKKNGDQEHDLLIPSSMQENLNLTTRNHSPTREGSGKIPIVSPHPPSRRAERAQHSLASNIPDEFNQTAELRSQFILDQLQKELAEQQLQEKQQQLLQ